MRVPGCSCGGMPISTFGSSSVSERAWTGACTIGGPTPADYDSSPMSLLHARRATLLLALPMILAGCRSSPSCDPDAEYRHAIDRPRLELPGTLSQSERMAPLVIPPVQADVGKLDPQPTCLDEPPPFFARKTT